MKLLKINIFLLIFSLFLVSCGQDSGDEDSAEPIQAPSALTYEEQSLSLERFKPLNFLIPKVTGDDLRFKVSPNLPEGLVLNSFAGTLAGIPRTTLPRTTFTITAYNSEGESSFQISIEITQRPIPEISYGESRFELPIGQELATPISLGKFGATYTGFSIDKPLPAGLNFNTADGSVTGTPTEFVPNSLHTVKGITESGNEVFTSLLIQILDYPPTDLVLKQDNGFIAVEKTEYIEKRDRTLSPIFPEYNGGDVEKFSIFPELPEGLEFNPNSGEITGTPVEMILRRKFTITASNSGGSISKEIFIEVQDIPPTNLTYNLITLSLRKTIPIANPISPTYDGGNITEFSISPSLPAGLNFNTLTGEISGNPSEVSPIQIYTITGLNNGGVTSTNLNIFVKDLPPQNLSYPIVSEIYVKNTPIDPLIPTYEGGSVFGFEITPQLPEGLSMDVNTGVISGTPLAVSDVTAYTVTASNSEGRAPYAFFIAVKDEAPENLRYEESLFILEKDTPMGSKFPLNDKGRISSYEISPILPPGLEFNTVTGELYGTPTAVVPEETYRVTGRNATGETFVEFQLLVNDKPPIDLAYGPNTFLFDRGVPIPNLTPTSFGGEIVEYRMKNGQELPSGLSLDSETGLISGVPGVRIVQDFYTIVGINTGGVVEVTVEISINDSPPENLSYGGKPLFITLYEDLGAQGIFPSNDGGSIDVYNITPELPNGLFLDLETGAIKGAALPPRPPDIGDPNEPGDDFPGDDPLPYEDFKSYTISGFNSGGATTVEIQIRVVPPKPIIQVPDTLSIQRDFNFEGLTPTVTGGEATGFFIEPTTLPDGLSFNSQTGEITGVPTTVTAAQEYTIRAINDGGDSSDKITIEITEIPPNNIMYDVVVMEETATLLSGTDDNINVSNTLNIKVGDTVLIDPEGNGFEDNMITNRVVSSIVSNTQITVFPYHGYTTGDRNYNIRVFRPAPTNGDSIILNRFIDDGITDYPEIKLLPKSEGGDVVSWSIDSEVSEGLIFSEITGIISGKPTRGTDDISYLISATNSGGTGTYNLKIKIKDLPPTNMQYDSEVFQFGSGELISIASPIYDGGEITVFSIDPILPTGLNFNTETGSIAKPDGVNVPASSGTLYTVEGCNAEGCTSDTFTLILTPDRPEDVIYGDSNFLEDDLIYFTLGDYGEFNPQYSGGLANDWSISNEGEFYPSEDFINTRAFSDENNILVAEEGALSSLGLNYSESTGIVSGTVSSYPNHHLYVFASQGINEGGSSIPAITLIYINRKPIANAGVDKQGTIFESISLNGMGSSDPDSSLDWNWTTKTKGKDISYTWRLISKPNASTLESNSLSSINSPTPSFIPDEIGYYEFGLTVNDGLSDSEQEDKVRVFVKDIPPANLTYGQQDPLLPDNTFIYHLGLTGNINLESTNSGGRIEEYSISPSLPAGLNFNTNTGRINGTPSEAIVPTDYTITGSNTGGSTSVTIKLFVNKKPEAIATAPEKVVFGNQINFNGESSFDEDGVYLETSPYNYESKVFTYNWSIKSKPAGSSLSDSSFININSATPRISPDKKGDYVFEMYVSDGYLNSDIVELNVSVGTPPSAISFEDVNSAFSSGNTFAYNSNDNVNISINFSGDSGVSNGLQITSSPSLPTGLSINTNTLKIEGQALGTLSPQTYSITIKNKGGQSSANLTLWYNALPIVNITNEYLFDLSIGSIIGGNASPTIDSDSSVLSNPPFTALSSYYDWKVLAIPADSAKQSSDILNSHSATPSLETDVAGIYMMIVNYFDGLVFGEESKIIRRDTVSIPNKNNRPLARVSNSTASIEIANNDNRIITELGETVTLDASSSEIFKGSYNYTWEFVSIPATSSAEILDVNAEVTSFTIDVPGTYQIKLILTDGQDSSEDFLFVTTENYTEIVDDITVDTTFTEIDSPIIITDNIEIRSTATLTIEEGVVVIGQGNAIDVVNGGLIIQGLIDKKVYLDGVSIRNRLGSTSEINIEHSYVRDSSICPFVDTISYDCTGNLSLNNNVFFNLKGDQRIGQGSSDINIKENIFIGSNGFRLTNNNNNIYIENNYIYNAKGGESGVGEYFVNIEQDIGERIKIEKNTFINPNNYLIIKNKNVSNQKSYIRYNYWNNSLDFDEIQTWISYPFQERLIPFVTSPFDETPDGRRFH